MRAGKARIKRVETIVEAVPAPGVTLEELEAKLLALGNPILRIDRERGVVVMIQKQEDVPWQP